MLCKQRLVTARIGEYFNRKKESGIKQQKKSDIGILKYTYRGGACLAILLFIFGRNIARVKIVP